MKVSEYVLDKVNRFQVGYVFTYTDFNLPVNNTDAVMKALNRMVKSGKIRKLSKGKFYKPKKSQFGELKPDVYQVVKDLLEKDGKLIGYITGYSIYSKLGLTTQIYNTIQIGVKREKKATKRGMYKIKFIKQPNTITKESIPLLRILDSIRNIKKIPDTTVEKTCIRLKAIINDLEKSDQELLMKLALKYNPATKTLVGAIIENVNSELDTEIIYKTLNLATSYSFKITEKTLPNKQKWFIK
ncbi:MAG: hypothetical protein KAR57_00780 [Bacteroidales bacterium]|nr:hypothetical protein [Bacteroidales bacterium]